MSSTRKAKDPSAYHQNRYASSPEFERGLMGNLVAKRCALLDEQPAIELIWFIQWLSWEPGGLAKVADDLIGKYPDRIATREMTEAGLKPGQICNADLVRKLRRAFEDRTGFLLKGEKGTVFGGILSMEELVRSTDYENDYEELEKAKKRPTCYPGADFFRTCRQAADSGLEKHLRDMCLDPASNATSAGPWYFPTLIATLHEMKAAWCEARRAGVVTTALGGKVHEVLDYTYYSHGLTLMQGNARLGKTFAARAWCSQRPGQARFVEVPPSNDDAAFFRALARGLGLGNFLQYKVTDIRERVESVLLTGNLLLVLDEAHRLWPQRNLRYGFPSRINWVMSMANHNVPICCIATPQFIEMQKSAVEKGRWNSAQLTGRMSHFETLPAALSESDLQAVAKAVLPEASAMVLRALATYASSSERYLAAIDSIAKRARFLAARDGRQDATEEDVRKAMNESVIPADAKLQRALESGRKAKLAPAPASSVEPNPEPMPANRIGEASDEFSPKREVAPADLAAPRRAGAGIALVDTENMFLKPA